MRKRVLFALLAGSLLAALAPGAAAASDLPEIYQGGPNQGAAKYVSLVDNLDVTCEDPIPTWKFEGDFGRKIFVWAPPGWQIDAVTVKSGKGAEEVWSWFYYGERKGWIKYSKDVSNYVVWMCPMQCSSS